MIYKIKTKKMVVIRQATAIITTSIRVSGRSNNCYRAIDLVASVLSKSVNILLREQ